MLVLTLLIYSIFTGLHNRHTTTTINSKVNNGFNFNEDTSIDFSNRARLQDFFPEQTDKKKG